MAAFDQSLVQRTHDYTRLRMSEDGSGHGWAHIERVWKMARHIGEAEGADLMVVELSALLHDLDDHKYSGDAHGPMKASLAWLKGERCDLEFARHIAEIVDRVSFKGAGVPDEMPWLEGQAVQDADRLDAIGAIGTARAFAYGGMRHRPLYDPTMLPQAHQSFADYRAHTTSTINHFYEKLLLLKDRMHTPTARRIAEERHAFMEAFVQRFLAEWAGEA